MRTPERRRSESVVLLCGEAALSVGLAQSDLKSDCCEYQDLQSANRISNAYIHCGRIANPPERGRLPKQEGLARRPAGGSQPSPDSQLEAEHWPNTISSLIVVVPKFIVEDECEVATGRSRPILAR